MNEAVRKRQKGDKGSKPKRDAKKQVPDGVPNVLPKGFQADKVITEKDVSKSGSFCAVCVSAVFVLLIALFTFVYFTDYGKDYVVEIKSNIHESEELVTGYQVPSDLNGDTVDQPKTQFYYEDSNTERPVSTEGKIINEGMDFYEEDSTERSDGSENEFELNNYDLNDSPYFGEARNEVGTDQMDTDLSREWQDIQGEGQDFIALHREYSEHGDDTNSERSISDQFSEDHDQLSEDREEDQNVAANKMYGKENITSREDMLIKDDLDDADSDFDNGDFMTQYGR